jgi:hypothetical protein
MALQRNTWYTQKLNEVNYTTGTIVKNKGG